MRKYVPSRTIPHIAVLQPGNETGLAGIPVHKCIQKMVFNIKVMGNINVFVSIECEDCVCININRVFIS